MASSTWPMSLLLLWTWVWPSSLRSEAARFSAPLLDLAKRSVLGVLDGRARPRPVLESWVMREESCEVKARLDELEISGPLVVFVRRFPYREDWSEAMVVGVVVEQCVDGELE